MTLVGADYGIISVLADGGNMGIIVFLVTLGIMVDLMNKGGGSEAFGRWAKKTVHTRCGAQLLTMLLGPGVLLGRRRFRLCAVPQHQRH